MFFQIELRPAEFIFNKGYFDNPGLKRFLKMIETSLSLDSTGINIKNNHKNNKSTPLFWNSANIQANKCQISKTIGSNI